MNHLLRVYVKPYRFRMAAGLLIKFAGTVMDLFLPWILAHMIDVVIPKGSMGELVLWGLGMSACSVLALFGSVTANRMAAKVSGEIVETLRHDLFEKIMHLPCSQVDAWGKPALISRLTSDSYHVHNMLSRLQRLGVRAPILLLGGLAMTLNLDTALASILLCLLPVLGIVIWQVTVRSVPMYAGIQEAQDGFIRLVREDISGIRVIKALSKTDDEKERFDVWNRRLTDRERKAGRMSAVLNPSMNLILNLGLVLVIIAGAFAVEKGTGEVGTILAFLTYFTIILNAMLSVSKMFTLYSKGHASAERISQILNAEDERLRPDIGAEGEADGNKEEETDVPFVAFRDVCFSYHPGKPVLQQISFSLEKGETLGIIGETGSGKSTVAALLAGLYRPDSGRVFAAGKKVERQTIGKLRSRMGIVFQNDSLFADTIRENVRFGRDLTDWQVRKAVRTAQAEAFVREKEGGGQERLQVKGANLSGGQKQRVLTARALAGDPDVLILDDSSSALDYRTDLALRKAMEKEYRGTAKILIAQRVSSVSHADRILVLEEGKMCGYGTHRELLKSCPVYRELYEMQSGLDEGKRLDKGGKKEGVDDLETGG